MLRLSGKGFLSVAFLFIFPINYFVECVPGMSLIYTIGQFLLCILIIPLFLEGDKYRLSNFIKLVFLLDAILLISTVKNGLDIFYCIKQELKWTIALIICEYALKTRPDNLIISWFRLFELYTLINTLSIIFYPEALYANIRGLWRCWFLGEDNVTVIYYIYAILMSYLYSILIKKGKVTVEVIGIIISFAFISIKNDIGTGKVCLVVLILLLVDFYLSKKAKELKLIYVVVAQCVIFVAVVLLQIQNKFADVLNLLLGKDVTFTGRTFLWSASLIRVLKTPLLGCGYYEPGLYEDIIGVKILAGINSPHNTYINIMLYGGFLAAALLLFMMIYAAKKFDANCQNKCFKIITITAFIILLRGHVEYMQPVFILLVFMFAYHVENVERLLYKR